MLIKQYINFANYQHIEHQLKRVVNFGWLVAHGRLVIGEQIKNYGSANSFGS